MIDKKNGKTSKLRREKNKFGNKLDSDSENKARADGQISGLKQERIDRTVDKARIFTRGERQTLGKILDQLQEIQREHIEYVEAHGDRLIQRLRENHDHKSKILGKMSALEEEVVRILDGSAENPKEVLPEEE